MILPHQNSLLTETLSRLDILTNWEKKSRTSMAVGLGPMIDLTNRLGNPQKDFRVIHVTGTKGKGSVCALLESAMVRAGRKVGRYSSPHIDRVAERISICMRPIDETILATALIQTLSIYDAAKREQTPGQDATWFDIFTATAYSLFSDMGLEWAIVEVGLGGRTDSTNVIDAEVAIVTNVELEHTEVLGSSREQIAAEKAGILKSRAVLVTSLCAVDAAGKVLHERAKQLGCEVLVTSSSLGQTIDQKNLAIAALTLNHLGRCGERLVGEGSNVSLGGWLLDNEIQTKARLPGRLERINIKYSFDLRLPPVTVPVILDGAHVPFNIAAVMLDLKRRPDLAKPCVSVLALAADKDAEGFIGELVAFVSELVVTNLPAIGRNRPAAVLGQLATSVGIQNEVEENPLLAFYRALDMAAKTGTWILVTGSLSLIGILRPLALAMRQEPCTD